MKTVILMSERYLEGAERESAENDPIARAIKDQVGLSEVYVCGGVVFLGGGRFGRRVLQVSSAVSQWCRDWDAGRRPDPCFAFILDTERIADGWEAHS